MALWAIFGVSHVFRHNYRSRGARKALIPSFLAPDLAWHIPGVQARPTWFADTRHIVLHFVPKMAILLHFFSSGCASWVHILFGGVRAPKGPEGSIMCAKTSLNFLRHSNPKILHFEVRKIPPFPPPPVIKRGVPLKRSSETLHWDSSQDSQGKWACLIFYTI